MISQEEVNSFRSSYKEYLSSELANADSYIPQADMLEGKWKNMVWPASDAAIHAPKTGVSPDILRHIGKTSVAIPDGFVRSS